MRKRKPFFLLIIAIVLGFLATSATAKYLERQGHASTLSGPVVITAAAKIAPGTLIAAEHLSEMRWPARQAPESLIGNVDQAIGKYACTEINAGEPLLKQNISEQNYSGNLVNYIPAGYRAMTIKIDRKVQSGGLLTPGSLVDVISVTGDRGRNVVSRTILQSIRVISVGARSEDCSTPVASSGGEETVTLLLKPAEAEQLALAISKGSIQVMARNATDTDVAETIGAADEPPTENAAQLHKPAPEPKMPAENPEVVAEKLFNRAKTAEAKGDWDEAVRLYNLIIDEYPEQKFAVDAVERIDGVGKKLREIQREKNIGDNLAAARDMLARGLFDECKRKIEAINKEFGEAEYKAHKMADIIASLNTQVADAEHQANIDFQMFSNLAKNNNQEHALKYLRKLEASYPESTYTAKAATIALSTWGTSLLEQPGTDDTGEANEAEQTGATGEADKTQTEETQTGETDGAAAETLDTDETGAAAEAVETETN